MQHLFQAWPKFTKDCRGVGHILLFCDYDGTLTPIVKRPQDAVLSTKVRNRLRILAERSGISLGIISGRSLAEVKKMVGVEGLYYAGNHGFEIEGPGLDYISPEAESGRALIHSLAGRLNEALLGIAGIIVEDKGLSLSVHYRLVREVEEPTVAEIFQRVTGPSLNDGRIRITTGKKVYEVRPPINWNKGRAVVRIAAKIKEALNLQQVLTIYLGDDNTDEDVFKVLHPPDGWSVYVGGANPDSRAAYYLDSTDEVAEFLSRMMSL